MTELIPKPTGKLFHWIGQFLKSAAAPMPSPELADLREATGLVKDAADHLMTAAGELKDHSATIASIAKNIQSGRPRPRKKKASK